MIFPSSKFMFAVLISTAPFALGQAPTTETPSNIAPRVQQDKQGVPKASPSSQAPVDWHQLQVDRFWGFSIEIVNEEGKAKRDDNAGGRLGDDRVNYAKILHITDSEDRVMRLIMLDAAERQATNESRWKNDDAWAHMRHAERSVALESLERERLNIFENAIARLKEQLGEDDFKKLDDHLTRTDARTVDAKRRAAAEITGGANNATVIFYAGSPATTSAAISATANSNAQSAPFSVAIQ